VKLDALKARILYKDSTKGELSIEVFNELVHRVFGIMDSFPSTEKLPGLRRTGFQSGRPFMHCLDQYFWDWLKGALEGISKEWEFGPVQMEVWGQKVARNHGTMLVQNDPKEELTEKKLLDRLCRFNPGLDVSKWKIYSMADSNNYIRVCAVAVDGPSYELLKKRDFSLNYPCGLVTFRLKARVVETE
jgi:hypothetical protein